MSVNLRHVDFSAKKLERRHVALCVSFVYGRKAWLQTFGLL